MKNRYFFSIIFILLTTVCLAQFNNQQHWHPGIVILNNDQIIKGDLSYDYANDLIMCQQDGKIKTFGPHQAASFRYYEEEKNLFHRFKVYKLAQNSFYSQKAFFEIVLDGKVDFIRKRNRYDVQQSREGYLAHRSTNVHEVAYQYYVLVNDRLVKARKFKKEVLPQLLLNEQSLESYMKEQKLRSYDIGDQIVLLNYYNERSERTKPTAIGQSAYRKGSD